MGIRLSEIRIQNFRSIEYAEAELNDTNILIGQNNSGKSNFLRAINIALNTNTAVSDQDIYVADGEKLTKDKTSIIDIMIRPVSEGGEYASEFSDFWTGVFTEKWISTDETTGAFVGIRTVIGYDTKFDQYTTTKRPISQWNDSIGDAICGKKQGFNTDMQSYIECFYMDAHRDILDDLNNKKSYFGRATSIKDIPTAVIQEVEDQLNTINEKLVNNTPALKSTQETIAQISDLFGLQESRLAIEPISRSINDLHRGMDVKFSDGKSPTLSASEQGMGTRSWISFLTLGAYITYLVNTIRADDDEAELFVVLALEEPEAHLHAYAQKRLFEQIKKFDGQKMISTHSANIVAQADICDFLHLYKLDGKTIAHRVNIGSYGIEELAKIKREFIRSKGDLLFSSAIVLAEGITEELAIPVYFREYFGVDPNSLGIAIIGIGGQNYKSFLHLLNDLHIPWLIFSDGEKNARTAVENAIQDVFSKSFHDFSNIIMLDEGVDYEKYLLNEGYFDIIVNAINKYEENLCREIDPERAKHDPKPFFKRYIEKGIGRGKNYSGDDGARAALINCLQNGNGKAKYAYVVADEIVSNAVEGKKIPPKIAVLFERIKKFLAGGDLIDD